MITGVHHFSDLLNLKYVRIFIVVSPGSSVSIVSGYGLDDRAIEVLFSVEGKGFFL
jgi:hypothetical protein